MTYPLKSAGGFADGKGRPALWIPVHPVFEDIDRNWKDHRFVFLYTDFGQSLQISQLKGHRLIVDNGGWFCQLSRWLALAVPLGHPLCPLCLGRNRLPHLLQREWREANRRYFHYKMDHPLLPDEMATKVNIVFYADPADAFLKAILE